MDTVVHTGRDEGASSISQEGDAAQDTRSSLVERYLHLTRQVMPFLARTQMTRWPVRSDHCFQRIVLDTVCGGVWYDCIDRPAYRHLTIEQADQAVALCDQIIAGTIDLADLNRRSLIWRGKLRVPAIPIPDPQQERLVHVTHGTD